MNVNKLLLAGGLLAIVGVGVVWYAGERPEPSPTAAAAETTFDSPSAPAEPRALTPSSLRQSVEALPASPSTDAEGAAPDTAPAQDAESRAIDELKREMTTSAYREQGGLYVDYLVSNGLARADAERLIGRGFRDAVECSFEAMRAEAEAEGVPFDTVLYAVEAMLHQGDGPLLRGVIDMDAVRTRELPCLLNVLQEVGIPAHVMEEIQRAASNR